MRAPIDLLELAMSIAEISGTTTDAATAERLLAIVNRLLSQAGLPDVGGGDLPPGPLHSAMVDDYEYE